MQMEQKGKSNPVTDGELSEHNHLFVAAYNDIKAGQSRKERIQKLASELVESGLVKTRIARAIVKKLTHEPLKITTDDYVRRVLGGEYKDYSQWGEQPVEVMKEKMKETKKKPDTKQVKSKTETDTKVTTSKSESELMEKKVHSDTGLEVEKTKQDDKEITTVYLKKPLKKPSIVPAKKIDEDDITGETEIELPSKGGTERYTQLEAKARVMEAEIFALKGEKQVAIETLNAKIDALMAENEELSRPYQQRQYVTVTAGNEPVIVAYFCVAKPKDKSLGVVKKSPIPLATLEEKKQDYVEWEKNLKPGRVSVDVNIDEKPKA